VGDSVTIPSKDYGRQYRALWPEIAEALQRAFFEDDPILGDAVDRFESALAAYHGVPHALGVASGMAAIELALGALGIGAGDEVVTCAHTFTGVVSAIVLAGATPRLVDADERGLLSVDAAIAAINSHTRAIVAVHLYGHPVVEIDRLVSAAADRGVHVVEDAAQAHGARWRGRSVGAFGVATALSFHPSKNLGAFGDGGAVLTRDSLLVDRLRRSRNLGKSAKYEFAEVARNEKLDTVQAALLEVKLGHLERWVDRRRALAARYDAGLAGLCDLRLPSEHADARHAYHLYVVRTKERDRLLRFLAEEGIRAGLHYPIAVHQQPAHAERFGGQSFPIAEAWARQVLTLPLSHEHRDDEIDRVIETVRRFHGR
jgi:dTDP-3-amino-3,4,6-trideoxy-alpha-D-glucose transaminase